MNPAPDRSNDVLAPDPAPDLSGLHQDSFRRVILGQASDPLFPPHPGPPVVSEAELAEVALADHAHPRRHRRQGFSPLWGTIALIAFACGILALVLWRRG